MNEKPITPHSEDEETLEGCVDKIEDVQQEAVTADEDLPAAEGGVA